MDGIIRFTGCGYDTMRSEDDYKINGTCHISNKKQEIVERILCKDMFGRLVGRTKEELIKWFVSFKTGSNNIPREKKVEKFYEYHVVDPDYSLKDIEEILKEVA